jgi:hypothetical protein
MNANDAQLVRISTRETNGKIADFTPGVSGAAIGGNISFDLVEAAEASLPLSASGADYTLSLTAFDKTIGIAAEPSSALTLKVKESFDSSYGNIESWPRYESQFPVTLTQAQADQLVGHVIQFTAILINPRPGSGGVPNIVSYLVSSPILLV